MRRFEAAVADSSKADDKLHLQYGQALFLTSSRHYSPKPVTLLTKQGFSCWEAG